jgi:hypothetical protein
MKKEEKKKGTTVVPAAASTSSLMVVTIVAVLVVMAYCGYKPTYRPRKKNYCRKRTVLSLCSQCV